MSEKNMSEKKWMAYNHNGTPLLNAPGTHQEASAELKEYMFQTGNRGGYVDEVEE